MTETAMENRITQGVIWKQLLYFFFPILLGTFFQQLYNTADAMIVGQFVGKEALAAVGGTTSVLINFLVNMFVGIASGATVVIAQYYGARQHEEVGRSIHTLHRFGHCGRRVHHGHRRGLFPGGPCSHGDAGGYHGVCPDLSAHLLLRHHCQLHL